MEVGRITFGARDTVFVSDLLASHPEPNGNLLDAAKSYKSRTSGVTKWDKRFIDLALYVAQWSKDPSTKVGCVLTDTLNRIISLGYNGPPRAVSDAYEDRDQKIRRTIHAEKNALAFAGRSVQGCTAYVTHPPCAPCAAYLIQHGITRVVYATPSEDFLMRWKSDYEEAGLMFAEAGVEVVCYGSTGAP